MSKTLKHSAGDEVFWLSPNGFRKGVVKKVSFIDEIINKGSQQSLKYYCWSNTYSSQYEGDKIMEDFVFTSYDEMVLHYRNNPLP